jgi:fumarate hydratase class I
MVLPGCQDTGTGIIIGKRGQYVWTDGCDEEHLSKGIFRAYTETNLRYSQVYSMLWGKPSMCSLCCAGVWH